MTSRQSSSIAYKLGAVGIAVFAATAGTQAFAQALATPYGYVGGNVGRAWADFDNSAVFGTAPAPITGTTEDDRDVGYKLFGGYQFHPNFAVEAGFHHLGDYNFGYTSALGNFAGNTRFRGGHLDLLGTWPVMDRLSVFGRVGAAYTRARTNVATTGIAPALGGSRTESKWGPKVGLGLEYAITQALSVRGEWERYRVRDPIRGRDNIDMASVGLVWRFGAPAVAPTRVVAPPPPPPPPPARVVPPPPPAPVQVVPPPAPAPAPAAPRPYRN